MMSRSRKPGNGRAWATGSLVSLLLGSLLVFGYGLSRSRAGGQSQGGGATTGITSNDKNCQADPAWVNSPSEPDPKTFKATSNCSFHQWAYQTFLWLTSKDGPTGRMIFENFANPLALFKPNGPTAPYPGTDDGSSLKMLVRFAKSRTTVDIEDIFQAGPGNKVLVDQNGEVVYYSNHLNKTFWNFIVGHKFYNLEKLQKAKVETNFDVGSLELKASWRVAVKDGKTLIKDAEKRFFVIEAEIPTVTENKGQLDDKGKVVTAKMALVGLHVTGVVKGHPEFIWATFEHIDNAPQCAGNPNAPAASGPGPTGPWSFYEPGIPTGQANQFDVNAPRAVVNVCLHHAQGGGSDGNKNAVKTLNKNVRALEKTGSLWQNYELGGAVWTDGHIPLNNGAFSKTDLAAGAEQQGSLDLANTTMETFTQNDNCFACHNGGAHEVVVGAKATEINAKHINLSHFVVNYQASEQVNKTQGD